VFTNELAPPLIAFRPRPARVSRTNSHARRLGASRSVIVGSVATPGRHAPRGACFTNELRLRSHPRGISILDPAYHLALDMIEGHFIRGRGVESERVGLMDTFTIALTEEQAHRLREQAREAGISPEQLLKAGVEEWLARPGRDFAEAAAHVLRKNHELYRRVGRTGEERGDVA
jgi:hypothetical protein